jgi:tRNA threonylcarbamoyl adenosine modification protein YeaZ
MILAIETSSPRAGLCLFEGGRSVWNARFVTDRSHNSKIFEPLSEALNFCDRKLEFIAVGTGPGSYSGVRVGIAAANGISLALNIPVAGISSLEAYESAEDDYLVVGDAKRKSFFMATVSKRHLQNEPELMEQIEFEARLSRSNGCPVLTVDQGVSDQFPSVEQSFPTVENVAARAAALFDSASEVPMQPVEPHYLRPPYITKAKKKPVPGFPG